MADNTASRPAQPDNHDPFAPLVATMQHLGLIRKKIKTLEDARTSTEEQFFASIAREYKFGALTRDDLVDLHEAFRAQADKGYTKRWDAVVPISAQKLLSYARLRRFHAKNGPDGLSWVGNYPIGPGDPAPWRGVSVVYVLYDDTNRPVYVGSSQNLPIRLKAHARDSKSFTSWMAYPCTNREDAYLLEEKLLSGHMPPLNKKAGR